jgi:hypothetical protein
VPVSGHCPPALGRTGGVGALAALALGLCGCGPREPTLEGSLTERLDLSYRRAEWVAGAGGEAAVRFLRPRGEGEDVVLKVTVRLPEDVPLLATAPVDLAARNPDGAQRGAISRAVLDDPRQTFPEIERGKFRILRLPEPGAKVPGEFNVTFSHGTHFSSGRTVFGDFEAQVP